MFCGTCSCSIERCVFKKQCEHVIHRNCKLKVYDKYNFTKILSHLYIQHVFWRLGQNNEIYDFPKILKLMTKS